MDNPCFELKGSLFTLTVLQLFDDDLTRLESELKERIKMAPGFFNHTPLVIDLNELSEEKQKLDFFSLRELLLSLSIVPVGIKGASKSVHTLLEAAGMAVLAEAKPKREINPKPAAKTQQKTDEEQSATSQQEVPEKENLKQSGTAANVNEVQATKVIKQTIRSGRQIYAPGGDLVIIGSVSAGAEILADGNIHIYGTLRGRALAGVRGNQSASIFCQSLQAELISIAGIYLLSDDISGDKIGQSVQISLEDEKLQLLSLS